MKKGDLGAEYGGHLMSVEVCRENLARNAIPSKAFFRVKKEES